MSLKSNRQHRPRVWYALFSWGGVAVVLLVGLTAGLGVWQLSRAHFKETVQAQWAAILKAPAQAVGPAQLADAQGRLPLRMHLRGRWLPDRSVWLDNRYLQGRAGFWLITPLRLLGASEGDPVVLVLRGWAPRDARDRTKLPAVQGGGGEVQVEGIAVAALSHLMQLSSAPPASAFPAIWQNLDYAQYERASGLRVARLVVYGSAADDSALAPAALHVAVGPETHYGYAAQWLALSAMLVVLGIYFAGRARGKGQAGSN